MAKKITAKKIMKALADHEVGHITVNFGSDECPIEVVVKPYLKLGEILALIKEVEEVVFSEDEFGGIQYIPGVEKFACEYAIVEHFTNVELPDNAEDAWAFLRATGALHSIEHAVGENVYCVERSLRNAINHRKEQLLKKSKLDDVLDSISSLMSAVKEKTDNIDLAQIMDYLNESNPALKGELEEFIRAQMAEESPAE